MNQSIMMRDMNKRGNALLSCLDTIELVSFDTLHGRNHTI